MAVPAHTTQNPDSLAWARLAKGYSQIALARAAGTTKGYISELESGRRSASLKTLQRIATVLGCPVDLLLSKCSDLQESSESRTVEENSAA